MRSDNNNCVLFFSVYALSVASRGMQNNFITLGICFIFRLFFSKIAILVLKLLNASLKILVLKVWGTGVSKTWHSSYFFLFFLLTQTVKSVAMTMKPFMAPPETRGTRQWKQWSHFHWLSVMGLECGRRERGRRTDLHQWMSISLKSF